MRMPPRHQGRIRSALKRDRPKLIQIVRRPREERGPRKTRTRPAWVPAFAGTMEMAILFKPIVL